MNNNTAAARTLATVFALSLSMSATAGIQETIDAAFALQQNGGTLADVRAALEALAGDDAADFALGVVDFLAAGESLVQEAHRTGFMGTFRTLGPMMGGRSDFLDWIANDEPELATHTDLRAAVQAFVTQLGVADEALAGVDDEFKCAIDLPAIRFDVNRDGVAGGDESLGALFALVPPRSVFNQQTREWDVVPLVPTGLVVAFDRGDAAWLRGYCHILMAGGELALAHDGSELFDHTAHIFFPRADITYDYLPHSTYGIETLTRGGWRTPTPFDITDVLVFFGNMRMPVSEPERMKVALGHLRTAVGFGREMWVHYGRETDNGREWVPYPGQTAAFGEVTIDEEMHDAWLAFLDEGDDVLAGRKVLRFWRGDGKRGIDVPKLFEEPQEFDLLYWIQGSAAAPYLREGEFTTPETWATMLEAFDRRVFRFGFWFN